MSKQLEMVLDISDDEDEELRLSGVTTLDITLSNGKKYPIMIHSSSKLFFTHFSDDFKAVAEIEKDVLCVPSQGDIILDDITPDMLDFLRNSDCKKQTFTKVESGYLIWIPLTLSFDIPEGEKKIKEFVFFTIVKKDNPFYMDIECEFDKGDVDFTYDFIEKMNIDLINNRMNTATSGDIASVLGYYDISIN